MVMVLCKSLLGMLSWEQVEAQEQLIYTDVGSHCSVNEVVSG